MKKLSIILCAMFLVFGFIASASADNIWLTTNVNQTSGWLDAEQTGFASLCWAASASNMLSFAKWDAGTTLTSETQIFSYFSNHWTNEYGNPYYAVEWWSNGSSSGGTATVTTPGGNFYPGYLFPKNGYAGGSLELANMMDYVESDVKNHRPFSMLLADENGTTTLNDDGLHWVTGWGYDDLKDGVWITDSIDGASQLLWKDLTFTDGKWRMTNYRNYYVLAMDSIPINDPYFDPVNVPNGPNGVPEPSTLLLLGSGLLGLFCFRKRI